MSTLLRVQGPGLLAEANAPAELPRRSRTGGGLLVRTIDNQMAEEKQVDDEGRNLILSFIGSLTLCDHMGDVSNDVDWVLKRLGLEIEWNEFYELGNALGKMGVKTLYSTSLSDEDEK